MSPFRFAFVLEQTLGHVTHAQNLRSAVTRRPEIEATWIPIGFELGGLGRMIPGFRDNWSIRASYLARSRLTRELAQRRFDAIFFHTQVTSLFSTAIMREVPSVVSLDATPLNYDTVGAAYGHRPQRDSWLDRRKHRMNRDAFAAARALVSWSEWAAASLVAQYGVPRERITVVAPGASSTYFEIGAERPSRARSDGPLRLLFVGGDFVRKGGHELLDAATAARTSRRFEVHVVTRAAVPEVPGVVVHRNVGPNTPELFDLFRSADAFVLPSHGECLSIALMEAAASGLPTIATDVGALGEAAIDRRTALVVAAGDLRALRIAIETMVHDDALRARLGRQAHMLARAKFDADRNNDSLMDLLAAVARQTGTRRVA